MYSDFTTDWVSAGLKINFKTKHAAKNALAKGFLETLKLKRCYWSKNLVIQKGSTLDGLGQ